MSPEEASSWEASSPSSASTDPQMEGKRRRQSWDCGEAVSDEDSMAGGRGLGTRAGRRESNPGPKQARPMAE
jgi:hypothetical protein